LPGVVCGYHLSIIAPNPGTSGAFIKRFFDSSFAKAYFAVRANGLTRVGLSQYALDNVELSFPPLPEQISIALFLGRETAKIDALVNEQQRLIKLMKEKRQAVVSHAVTNGLDPNAPVKDSGVEWLDQVPEHWDISRVKYNCSVKGRIGFRGYTTADQVDEGDGALVLGATHITSLGEINIDEPVFLSWEKYFESPEIAVSPSDVLVVQRGSTCGKVGFVSADNGPATINPSLVLLKDFACSPRFLFHYLSSAVVQGFFNGVLGSTAIPMLSQEQIGNIVFCVPPRSEQDDIVAFVDSETTKLDILAAEAQRAIDLLLECRKAIISDAVTGKIDVRELAEADAPDPDAVAA
jgi:type I restriction enzyme S subunit